MWFLFDRGEPNVNEVFLEYLGKLTRKEIPLERSTVELLPKHPELLEQHFLEFSRKLSETETKYFKFLSPEIVKSIVEIQNTITGLKSLLKAHVGMKKLGELISEKESVKMEEKMEMGDALEPLVGAFFGEILKEIEFLQKLGIEIYPNTAHKSREAE